MKLAHTLATASLVLGLSAAALAQTHLERARHDRDSANSAALTALAKQAQATAGKTKSGADYLAAAKLYSWAIEAAEDRHDMNALPGLAQAGVSAAQTAVTLSPKSPEAHALLGSLLGQLIPLVPNGGMRYGQQSMQESATAVSLGPKNVIALTDNGILLLYMPAAFGGGASAAIPELQKATAADPNSDTAHLWLAQAYESAKNWPQAEKEIATALRLDPQRLFTQYISQKIHREAAAAAKK